MDFSFLEKISDDELYKLFEKTIEEMNRRKTKEVEEIQKNMRAKQND